MRVPESLKPKRMNMKKLSQRVWLIKNQVSCLAERMINSQRISLNNREQKL